MSRFIPSEAEHTDGSPVRPPGKKNPLDATNHRASFIVLSPK
jgi:hypothetical protein